MTDFINKIISIVLVFLLLVLAPLLISYKTDEMIAKRAILNDVNTFIDKVTDAGAVYQEDVDEIYLKCNSYGLVVDVNVERLVYATTLVQDTGEYIYDYVVDKDFSTGSLLNPNDMIRVTVRESTYSSTRRLTYNLLKVDEGAFEFSLCGLVG